MPHALMLLTVVAQLHQNRRAVATGSSLARVRQQKFSVPPGVSDAAPSRPLLGSLVERYDRVLAKLHQDLLISSLDKIS